MDRNQTINQLERLRNGPRDKAWSSEFLHLAEHLWDAMSDPDLFDSALNPETVTRFANFLKADTNALELAQQVIPALREEEGSAHSRYQQHVLRHLETQRTTYALRQTWTQDAFDTKAYTKEKETFQGAELHRARLFVQRNEHLSSDEKQDVVKWLEQCPLAMRRAAQKSREDGPHVHGRS